MHTTRLLATLGAALLAAPSLAAQTTAASTSAPRAASHEPPAASTVVILPVAQQIAAAVLPAPKELRESATVLGYAPDGKFVTLRAGTGPLVCLASDPKIDRFHVACYHRSMEAFMARGRELRASGVKGDQVDTVRYAEVKAGKLQMPKEPAMLYSLTGPADSFDAAAGTADKARHLYVTYIPGATAESTGLSAVPVQGQPWIMYPGTPKAHIMYTPRM